MTESAPSGLISYRWWCSSATIIAVRSSSVMMAGMCLPTVSALMGPHGTGQQRPVDARIGDPLHALVEQVRVVEVEATVGFHIRRWGSSITGGAHPHDLDSPTVCRYRAPGAPP